MHGRRGQAAHRLPTVGALRLYATVTAGGLRRYATYRASTVAGIVTNTVFGMIIACAYLALWDERPHLGGYDQAQALTYVWVGQALYSVMMLGMPNGVEVELMERIRSGDIAVDLYRPVDQQCWWLSLDLGRALYQLIGRGVVPLTVGALVFPLALPHDVLRWLAFLVSVLLGCVVSFALRHLVAMSAFWLMEGNGAAQMYGIVGTFFSGILLPLNVFPGAIGDLARALPWSSLLQIPADVLMGTHPRRGVLGSFLFQAAWGAGLLAVGRAVQTVAVRRVVVQGG
ncbi:ABC-2 family transporter protein [Streptomyces sp. VRA16 Mangrove soil]|uniref:ABC transporter permease n=1 Tax=Streptomyces sp. VRA16 Mangrove soil TaxID=2817434 RepID=UPI001A9DF700|nr:ABC-2 family transporter protein [Streptomyces sp. VRA16 Mangrove soil]MBO1337714.1 ABC-2 family transporter protein [Streptomyces sp. VRA16 Mangrove soil]